MYARIRIGISRHPIFANTRRSASVAEAMAGTDAILLRLPGPRNRPERVGPAWRARRDGETPTTLVVACHSRAHTDQSDRFVRMSHLRMNERAWSLADDAATRANELRIAIHTLSSGARVLDAGIQVAGG